MSEGFDVNKSQVDVAALQRFLIEDLSEDIRSIPGIGPKAAEYLAQSSETDSSVQTSYQLVGKFLALRAPGISSKEHCDAFWFYLQSKGVNSHRSGIVQCIAEKVNAWIPGIYEPSD